MATETVKDNRSTSFGDEKNRYLAYSYSTPAKRPPPSDEEKAEDKATQVAQNIRTAKPALEYYNKKNNVKFELVDPITSSGNVRGGGIWYHCNFSAKPEGQDSSLTKVFFAELKVAKCDPISKTTKFMCTTCRPLAGKTTEHCEMCGDNFMLHPTTGLRYGRYQFQSRALRPRSNGKVLQESKKAKVTEWVPYGPSLFPTN
ncbi:uncharacterized protein LOC141612401 [Silene latifolia]|uniref:uncharacterized protein LOC141612401 n=1 Tax=Silene latifolia TaxID=37657 RepID=UPI003D77FC72